MNPQHTHPYPEVEFDQDGKLTAEGEARAAIKSLPEGELLDQILMLAAMAAQSRTWEAAIPKDQLPEANNQ